jgi:urease alpha subunit
MSVKISRKSYATKYGPTTGDQIRLADMDLWVEIEKDHTVYGEEVVFGTGKTARDGMAICPIADRKVRQALDLVITNAIIIDYWGIVKADIGIREGKIVGIGKAGNPLVQPEVDPNMVMGPGTEVFSGEGLIATPGLIDSHIHFICPQQCWTALNSGITTMIGGGSGPNTGTDATTCTPGPWHIERMYQAAEGLPVNIGYLGKGNGSGVGPLVEQIRAGAIGLKVHEDWAAPPAPIDASLRVADEYDVQIALHTDTMNESGFVEETIKAIGGRTIHTYHTEGAGGGHAPDIMVIAGEPNVLPSSTNAPSRPYTVNSVDEGIPMVMVTHHLNPGDPEDQAFADSRIRGETMAAESILHDRGILSMYTSDSQAMGRVGETIIRCWQTASQMKSLYGDVPAKWNKPGEKADNLRAKRYLAKLAINPAITHGISQYVGSLEVGKYADIVLWRPDFFGCKPEVVFKNGFIMMYQMGDPNASIPTPEPVYPRDMFAAFGSALQKSCLSFVSQAGYDLGVVGRYGLERTVLPVRNCRNIGKKDLKLNDHVGKIEINPETFRVTLDGELLPVDAAKELPLTQRYFLF